MGYKIIDANKKQELFIKTAHSACLNGVPRCISRLQSAGMKTGQSYVANKSDPLVEKYFAIEQNPKGTLQTVILNYRSILEGLRATNLTYNVDPLPVGTAFVQRKGSIAQFLNLYGKNEIHLTNNFFTNPYTSLGTIIHELSHLRCGTHDLASYNDHPPTKFINLKPEEKIKNAYNYGAFALELVKGFNPV